MYKVLFIFIMFIMQPVWSYNNYDDRHSLSLAQLLDHYGYNDRLDQKAKEALLNQRAIVIDLDQYTEYPEQLKETLKEYAVIQKPGSIKLVVIQPYHPLGKYKDWWYLLDHQESELLVLGPGQSKPVLIPLQGPWQGYWPTPLQNTIAGPNQQPVIISPEPVLIGPEQAEVM